MSVSPVGTSSLGVPQSSTNLATAGTAGSTVASPLPATAGTAGSTASTAASSSNVNAQQLMAMLAMILAVTLPALLGKTGAAGSASGSSGSSSQAKEELKSTSQLAPAIQQLKQQNPNASPQDIATGLNSRFSNTQFAVQPDGTLQYPLSGKNFKVVPDGQSQPTQA